AALAYQVAKEICSMSAVLHGRVDAIILTGGLMHDQNLTQLITERIEFLGRVLVYPGEDEMRALCEAAQRALEGEEPVLQYPA
ncbi:MAG: butyrate kinase, partial [Deltaproteobacteria bacterium]|nr:butyrate kinase [Deltaproteobacteria bacterium]